MLCSVIIALYNKAAYIEATLASVLAQTHADWEVVVVDDGSTDDGAARVQACRDPRVRLVRQANGGVSRARNRGIAEARGELVCFLDADDWYAPDYLRTQVAMAQAYPGESYFATGFQGVTPGSQARLAEAPALPQQVALVDDFFARCNREWLTFFTGSVAARRGALWALQPCFPEGEQFGEDLDLWFRLAERHRLVQTTVPLVAYRLDVGGSLSATHGRDKVLPVFARLEQRARSWPGSNPARRPALLLVSNARVVVARELLEAGRRGAAVAEMRRAMRDGVTRHWWSTALMCALFTPAMTRRWSLWRKSRIAA
ncbi:glycosyltransferase family 2 protein [Janthinobacterium psychrotolerans]|uniref:Glycosyl transferase family 2 n=1 Tax=Janthinobacterium psychrotolerans TaxID=1747903 RepID=A0A1A7C6J5_9BURK|nr:glycosyltransferase family A protein [Janthinobacterium psychrotolerans]OBV40659.1 Glycosyl transferase family 2 [Janthinobacterium psychrotolerans]